MYESYWKLKEKPFKNTPDPKFLCPFTQYSDALMKLTYAVRENMGAAMLTGVYGCGKTFIARALLDSLSRGRYSFAYLTSPPASGAEFFRAIVRTLKYSELPTRKTELLEDALLESLQMLLIENNREGKDTVVIVDEAHAITDERIFEKMRLLLNFQTKEKFLLTLIMVGQPELAGKVKNLRQLEQRIAVKCHLEALKEKETREYITHRLKIAGREEPLFQDNVFKLIHSASGGIPRRVNHICDACLMTGFARKKDIIDKEIFRESGKIFGETIFTGEKL
ncbi:MAG: AAA family ATPase [Candidatus Euphemobacter frigidus]|nr:AAA family ATPase [Candidatus Euphemobacter frigidus]MDP8275591.1 AAA family ATPase [Candidatus Euphemobacter frigidus]